MVSNCKKHEESGDQKYNDPKCLAHAPFSEWKTPIQAHHTKCADTRKHVEEKHFARIRVIEESEAQEESKHEPRANTDDFHRFPFVELTRDKLTLNEIIFNQDLDREAKHCQFASFPLYYAHCQNYT